MNVAFHPALMDVLCITMEDLILPYRPKRGGSDYFVGVKIGFSDPPHSSGHYGRDFL